MAHVRHAAPPKWSGSGQRAQLNKQMPARKAGSATCLCESGSMRRSLLLTALVLRRVGCCSLRRCGGRQWSPLSRHLRLHRIAQPVVRSALVCTSSANVDLPQALGLKFFVLTRLLYQPG